MKPNSITYCGTFVLLITCASLLSGCGSIKHRVVAVPVGTTIETVYIESNSAVLMDEMVTEIQRQIKAMGYDVKIYAGERPKDAVHCLKFTANWRWDMAMYLTYFHATLLEEERVLGTAEYDARSAGLNGEKFGHTADFIRPIIRELLKNAHPAKATATPLGQTP